MKLKLLNQELCCKASEFVKYVDFKKMSFSRISELIEVLNLGECISKKYIGYDISHKM